MRGCGGELDPGDLACEYAKSFLCGEARLNALPVRIRPAAQKCHKVLNRVRLRLGGSLVCTARQDSARRRIPSLAADM